jgi:hypothetical protein
MTSSTPTWMPRFHCMHHLILPLAVLLLSVPPLSAGDALMPWARPKPPKSKDAAEKATNHDASTPRPISGTGKVRVAQQPNGDFVLLRDGKPYYVKGIGGSVNFELAAASGANSVRTWGTGGLAQLVPEARKHGLSVAVGFWLDKNPGSYANEGYKNRLRDEVRNVVSQWAKDPAILCWVIGNETNHGADTDDTWKFIGELAKLCKDLDKDHPVMTVQAHPGAQTMDRMVNFAPAIDILGVNSYAGVTSWPNLLGGTTYKGPYIVTEWGVNGHWEVAKTKHGAPIEQTSTEKSVVFAERYAFIVSQKERCLGSYAFLWGQKQERTPTWYSLFVETLPQVGISGEATGMVDALSKAWSGTAPGNLAPTVEPLRIQGRPVREYQSNGKPFVVNVVASDPNRDKLTYRYEVMAEATQLGSGGSFEDRPASVSDAWTAKGPEVTVTVGKPGNYRLFAYVLDGKGKVGTANLPFWVTRVQ